ncbi:MAG TPA: hypothetical protein VHZ29_19445 [Rhizomicrobium sp.]|nr:hypothetical protein [Rhizomicrobium sp.]
MADAGRAIRSGLKVLFITGFAKNAAIGSGHLDPGMEILAKPFAMAAHATRVREILESCLLVAIALSRRVGRLAVAPRVLSLGGFLGAEVRLLLCLGLLRAFALRAIVRIVRRLWRHCFPSIHVIAEPRYGPPASASAHP